MFRRSVSRFNCLALLVLAPVFGDSLGASRPARAELPDEDPRPVLARSKPEEHRLIVLDLRAHLLYSPESEAVTTALTMPEILRVLEGVNRVWSQAGIRWRPAAISRVEARDATLHERFLAGEIPRRRGMMGRVVPADMASDGGDK